jgi:hypothetical protein
MRSRIQKNGSCVIVIAEGAGQVSKFKEIKISKSTGRIPLQLRMSIF